MKRREAVWWAECSSVLDMRFPPDFHSTVACNVGIFFILELSP